MRGSRKDYAKRAAIAKFSADFMDDHGRLPTISEAAKHFGSSYITMYAMAQSMPNRDQLFAPHHAVAKERTTMTASMRFKLDEARKALHVAWPDWKPR